MGLILTLGVDEKTIKESGMNRQLEQTAAMMGVTFGASELLIAPNSSVFRNTTGFAAESEAISQFTKNSDEIFTVNCQKAFDMGTHLLGNR